jgi:hypothetical protein
MNGCNNPRQLHLGQFVYDIFGHPLGMLRLAHIAALGQQRLQRLVVLIDVDRQRVLLPVAQVLIHAAQMLLAVAQHLS